MAIVKVGDDKYINVDRMTYAEPGRKGKLVVRFDVGGGDIAGSACRLTLDQDEAERFRQWLDSRSRDGQP